MIFDGLIAMSYNWVAFFQAYEWFSITTVIRNEIGIKEKRIRAKYTD